MGRRHEWLANVVRAVELLFLEMRGASGDYGVLGQDCRDGAMTAVIGYDWQNWSMINGLFSRLVDYQFGTTEVIPLLADSWTIARQTGLHVQAQP